MLKKKEKNDMGQNYYANILEFLGKVSTLIHTERREERREERTNTYTQDAYFYFAKIFGSESVERKKYLHNMLHAHTQERICMSKGLATAEEFEMEGREHKNKIFSRFYKSKFEGIIETKKRGMNYLLYCH